MKQTVNVLVLPDEVDEKKEIEKQENTQAYTHERSNRKDRDNSGIHTIPCRHNVCSYIRQT